MELKFLYGLKENLDKAAIVDGQVLICTNTGEMFVDLGGARLEIADTDEIKGKLEGIAEGATKVEASATNGYIKINGVETKVYELPTLKAENISDFAEAVAAVKVNAAGTADKVAHTLTVKVGGADVTFDGSADKTADVDAAIEAAINAIPEQIDYTVTCTDTDVEATEGVPAYKRHTLAQNGQTICTIDVPKDLVVQSGTVEEVTTADVPYAGAVVGDKYIKLVIANQTEPIYIPAKDLVDIYTAAAGATQVQLDINGNNEISATLVDGGVSTAKIADGAVTEAKLEETLAARINDTYTKNEVVELNAAILAEAQKYADEKVAEAHTWGTF